jgi:hypothetical protein
VIDVAVLSEYDLTDVVALELRDDPARKGNTSSR